jgi:hypothetical protein
MKTYIARTLPQSSKLQHVLASYYSANTLHTGKPRGCWQFTHAQNGLLVARLVDHCWASATNVVSFLCCHLLFSCVGGCWSTLRTPLDTPLPVSENLIWGIPYFNRPVGNSVRGRFLMSISVAATDDSWQLEPMPSSMC